MGTKYMENVTLWKWHRTKKETLKKSKRRGSVGGRGSEMRERRLRDKVKDKATWSVYVCVKELSVGW